MRQFATMPTDDRIATPGTDSKKEWRFQERYQMLRSLGQGSMGIVSEVLDHATGQRVALKTVRPGAPERHAQSLLAEAQLLAQLDHPGIIPVYDVGTLPDGRPFYTMKLIHGASLERLFAQQSISLRVGVFLLKQVCDVLAYAHEHGLIHCDLKPGNILVDRHGEIWIIDWGTSESRINATPTASSDQDIRRNKRDGYLVNGTPLYIAPEVLRGERPGPRADQYAIGVMLYELLTHEYPFYDEEILTLFHHICCAEVEPPSQKNSKTPAVLEQICLRLLAKTPSERFENCGNISPQLNAWLHTQTPTSRRAAEVVKAPAIATSTTPSIPHASSQPAPEGTEESEDSNRPQWFAPPT